jgi:SAM-dependent methyltransferase
LKLTQVFNPPNYSAKENFINPKLGPWTFVLYMHRKKILNSLSKAIPYLKGDLLDIGCGNKPYQSIIQSEKYIGVDVSLSPHEQDNFDIIFDGLNLPFSDNFIDSILCTEVLEHATNPEKLMNEIYRVLKLNGHAFITVPMFIEHHEIPYDYRRLTYYGMNKLAKDVGFEVIFIDNRGSFLSVLIATIYMAISQFISLRPFSDIIYFVIFPFTYLIFKLDKFKKKDPVIISLGWQMLIKKSVENSI